MLHVVYYAVISGLIGMRERMINVEMDGHESAWGRKRKYVLKRKRETNNNNVCIKNAT